MFPGLATLFLLCSILSCEVDMQISTRDIGPSVSKYAMAQYGGEVFYVDGTDGDDLYDGKSWIRAKATIQGAVDVAEAWSTIFVAEGIYPEKITIGSSLSGLIIEGVSKAGTKITAPDDTEASRKLVEVAASDVTIRKLEIECYGSGGGNNGVCLQPGAGADNLLVEECSFSTTATGLINFARGIWSTAGAVGIVVKKCRFEDAYMWTGCVINTSDGEVVDCLFSMAAGGETLYVYGDRNLVHGNTIENGKYGLWLGTGAEENSIFHNNLINNSTHNARDNDGANYWFENYYDDAEGSDADGDGILSKVYSFTTGTDQRALANRDGWHQISLGADPLAVHHEKVYPWDTVGVTVTPGNAAWGTPAIVVPLNGIITDYGWAAGGAVVDYHISGLYLTLTAVGGKTDPLVYQVFRITAASVETLSGDALLGQAVVPVTDTSFYLADDWVWLVDGDTPNGEIGQVLSIIDGTSFTLTANLVADFTVAQTAKVYLIRRGNDNEYRSLWGKFIMNTDNEMVQRALHDRREMAAGDGVLARGYGINNADPAVFMSIVYDDEAT